MKKIDYQKEVLRGNFLKANIQKINIIAVDFDVITGFYRVDILTYRKREKIELPKNCKLLDENFNDSLWQNRTMTIQLVDSRGRKPKHKEPRTKRLSGRISEGEKLFLEVFTKKYNEKHSVNLSQIDLIFKALYEMRKAERIEIQAKQ